MRRRKGDEGLIKISKTYYHYLLTFSSEQKLAARPRKEDKRKKKKTFAGRKKIHYCEKRVIREDPFVPGTEQYKTS